MNKKKDVIIKVPTAHVKFKALPPKIIIYEIHWEKDWWKLSIVLILIVTSQWFTSYIMTGWLGMILGLVLSVGIFFLGIYAVTRTVTKNISS